MFCPGWVHETLWDSWWSHWWLGLASVKVPAWQKAWECMVIHSCFVRIVFNPRWLLILSLSAFSLILPDNGWMNASPPDLSIQCGDDKLVPILTEAFLFRYFGIIKFVCAHHPTVTGSILRFHEKYVPGISKKTKIVTVTLCILFSFTLLWQSGMVTLQIIKTSCYSPSAGEFVDVWWQVMYIKMDCFSSREVQPKGNAFGFPGQGATPR